MTQLTVTDGTTSVSFVDASGFSVRSDNPRRNINTVAEKFTARLRGTSHDNIADQVITVNKLLRKGGQYDKKKWQETPVYMIAQTRDESNPRFALISSGAVNPTDSTYQKTFDRQNYWRDVEVTINRAGYWQSIAPETMPSAMVLGNGAVYQFQDGSDSSRLSILTDAAMSGNYGGAIRVDGAGTEAYWIDNAPSNESPFVVESQINLEELTLGTGETFSFLKANGSGTGGIAFLIDIIDVAGVTSLRVFYYNDAGGVTTLATVPIVDKATYKTVWSAATAPAANDGAIEFFEGSVSKGAVTNIDNDGHDVDSYYLGAESGLDAGTSGNIYVDRIRWADADDGVWHKTVDFEGSVLPNVGAAKHTNRITDVYNYDDNLAAFSVNEISNAAITMFEVSGSTPAVNDIFYMGSSDGAFYNVSLKVATKGVYNVTLVTEYWDGGAWVAITGDPNKYATFDGYEIAIAFSNHDFDWAKTVINGVNAYWLRVRISVFTSWTTSPILGREVYTNANNYLEIASSQINGDFLSKMLIRWMLNGKDAHDGVGLISIGAKSRGLKNFTSMLNAGGDNPRVWTENYDVSTTQVAAAGFPGEFKAKCTFADNSLQRRFYLSLTDAQIEADYEGVYRVFLRCRQDAGSAGDVQVQFANVLGTKTVGELVSLTNTGDAIEVVDLGRTEIFPTHIRGDEVPRSGTLDFEIWAQATSGTPNLDIHGIILIPIDEWAATASWQGLAFQLISATGSTMQMDAGILRKASMELAWIQETGGASTPREFWGTRGKLPEVEPGTNYRFYYMPMSFKDSADLYAADYGLPGLSEFYNVERWKHLRGGE